MSASESPDWPGPWPDVLAAYADGELDAAGRAEVERWLAEHPGARADLAAQRELSPDNWRLWQQVEAPLPAEHAWMSVRNAVAVPAHDRAEVSRPCEVPLQIVATEDNVVEPAAPIGDAHGYENRPVGDRAHFEATGVAQREQADVGSIRQSAERVGHSLTRSAILMIFFWSMLFRMAMPVRHDIAPARESGSFM